ncbi:high-affinity choline transporter 1 [Lepeophtheirus salmonis]|uniref:Uncharacterized protein n=1 Tax=Lepeophtheirus salmonis TaxID=72036 RepID=A0A0K2U5P6_LEPSM|nr:high-affinity choline transporter 1-like [Lepeophtheirus salmonis]XP_040571022.1 high-affinity choline transporter 1-like [Lepeophtheirus salmonis]XP_040571023.1 high-affinity choline transporter 1-like [Lepeophtheirus salmonis]
MGDQGLGSPLYPGNNTMVEEPQYSFNATGLASIIVFYIIILLIGLWAGWKQKKRLRVEGRKEDTETVLVANRDIKLFVGIMTMGATWVGGGFINGTAEEVYTNGLVHTLAPFGYSLSILFNAVLFAKKMRESNYITMIDPFTEKYGKLGSIIAFPAAMSEIIWSASILGALGSTLQVILGINLYVSIISSAVISVVYTLLGGLISVAYTDVFQLFFMATGLFLAIPFVLTNPATGNITDIQKYDWIGTVTSDEIPGYVDNIFTYILGGIPWQCYYQRVLSSKTPRRAQWLSVGGCSIALFMIIPSAIFGAAGKAIDWSKTPIPAPSTPETRKIILPLVLQYLTPGWVTFFGMGAVSAAVMSSTDSSMLSAASMLARNVYQKVFRPKASEKEILIILSTIVAFNCVLATLLAIYYPSVYDLFAFCSDLVYVLVFPQLLLVFYMENYVNTYGCVTSFALGLLLRILYGFKELGMIGVINFGVKTLADGKTTFELTPYKTILMLITLSIHIFVSLAAHILFTKKILDLNSDFLKCFHQTESGDIGPRTSRHFPEKFEMDSMKTAK